MSSLQTGGKLWLCVGMLSIVGIAGCCARQLSTASPAPVSGARTLDGGAMWAQLQGSASTQAAGEIDFELLQSYVSAALQDERSARALEKVAIEATGCDQQRDDRVDPGVEGAERVLVYEMLLGWLKAGDYRKTVCAVAALNEDVIFDTNIEVLLIDPQYSTLGASGIAALSEAASRRRVHGSAELVFALKRALPDLKCSDEIDFPSCVHRWYDANRDRLKVNTAYIEHQPSVSVPGLALIVVESLP